MREYSRSKPRKMSAGSVKMTPSGDRLAGVAGSLDNIIFEDRSAAQGA